MLNFKSNFLFILSLFSFVIHTTAQEKQPFYLKTKELIKTLDVIGAPISESDKVQIFKLIEGGATVETIHGILDKYVLLAVQINPESRVKVGEGIANHTLLQNGWKTFLVRVENLAGITAKLEIESPQAKRTYDGGERIYGMAGVGKGETVTATDIRDRWLDLSLYTQNPMKENLSGMEVDYFIVQLYSRDAGKRAATFAVNCGQATQDIGFRNETSLLFDCQPAYKIKLEITDEHQLPTTASLIIKDKQEHINPSQMKRLAPDFFFQPQVYRTDGEFLELPEGNYSIEYTRGPEYLAKKATLEVTDAEEQYLNLQLDRWIDPSKMGWYSGDHHIHAAGCAHYTSPTQGVNPEDIFRHLVGEALNVGSVLTWGQGYDHQKQFFEGTANHLSSAENLLRYDLEISGFPSSHAGHLVLLRLKDQYYPGTNKLEDWPTYTLPILKWAKAQGAITGYAHSGFGLAAKNDSLPNYEMPGFDGIGANEYIVAVTQNLVDFISTMDTPPTWELNIWYHTLNCGFRTRISGETDFPCITDQRVGQGRSYVKMDTALNFDTWAAGLKSGRTYTSDGKSHLMDFNINGIESGTNNSEVKMEQPSKVTVHAKVAARLNETIDP
ncbi:MAG TPA: CehA/McbA family metallohydrolase, partial [Chitinophagales bacterium]|nr:CehA/McbA family metallohydrolase [Chitinophagales bacterium]